MPIPWLVILQGVPWTDVIRNAPKVADGARKLWDSLRSRTPSDQTAETAAAAPATAEPESPAQLQARVAALQAAVDDLRAKMLESSELIATLAEQNRRLIERAEALRIRIRRLKIAVLLIGALAAVGLALGLAR